MTGHIIVAGLGRVGSRVASILNKNGFKVVGIENNPENEFAGVLRGIIPIITGDAQQSEILAKAGIDQARVLAAVTDDDLRNTNVILQGKRANDAFRSVARIFNKNIESSLVSSKKIESILSSSAIAAPVFVASALCDSVITAFHWEGSIYVIFEHPAGGMISEGELSGEYGLQVLPLMGVNGGNGTGDNTLLLGGEYGNFVRFCAAKK